jgi:hypothetical protein
MLDTLFEKQPALIVPVVLFVGTTLVFLVWIVAHYWKRVREVEGETALKRDMLARGMSVDEIERVLVASGKAGKGDEVVSENEYGLIDKMLDLERPIEEIMELLRVLKGAKATPQETIAEIMKRR